MRAYRIAYDGSDYHGFQRQPDVPTVSDAILDALRTLDVVEDRSVPPGYAAAGRTDAGVSATHQTVAFEAPDWLDPAALNSELPADIRAWASTDVPEDFHATHDATAREYTYYLYAANRKDGDRGRKSRAPDVESVAPDCESVPPARAARAREVLDRFAGEQDLHNLTPDGSGTVRDLDTAATVEGAFLVLTVRADGFPRQLVRRLVSVVDEVVRSGDTLERVSQVLDEEALEGPDGVPPARPFPLILTDVEYPAVGFRVDESATSTLRELFDERRRRHATLARVAGRLRDC